MLDGFAGSAHLQLRSRYREAQRECERLGAELSNLRERDGSRERDLDLFRYELSEIEAASDPDPAEPAALAGERERLRHAEGLREAAQGAFILLAEADEDGSVAAASALAAARAQLRAAAGVDAELDSTSERLEALSLELADLCSELRSYAEDLEADPARLALVEEQLQSASITSFESTGAASSRCLPMPSAAAPRSAACKAERSAPRRPRRP